MADPVDGPERGLPALVGPRCAVYAPGRVERGVRALDQAELREAAGAHLERRVLRRRLAHAGSRVPLRRVLRVAHELIDAPLLRRVGAAHRDGAGNVRSVAAIFGRCVDHHHVAGPRRAGVLHVVELCAVRAGTHDRAVGGPLRAQAQERALERRPQLVLVARVCHEHRRAMPLGADRGRPRGAGRPPRGSFAPGGGPRGDGRRVRPRPRGAPRSFHERPTPRERVGGGEVRRLEVVERAERMRGDRERVDVTAAPRRGDRDAELAEDGDRVRPPAVIERRARVDGREEERRVTVTPSHHHDEGRIGLVEPGEIVKRRVAGERVHDPSWGCGPRMRRRPRPRHARRAVATCGVLRPGRSGPRPRGAPGARPTPRARRGPGIGSSRAVSIAGSTRSPPRRRR